MNPARSSRGAARRRPTVLFGALIAAGIAASTGPASAQALSPADWPSFALTPAATESFTPTADPGEIVADASGRTTVVWTRTVDRGSTTSRHAVVARTRSADGTWSPERTLSTADEATAVMLNGAARNRYVTASANGAGDVVAAWTGCTPVGTGSPDFSACRVRWAVQRRGTTTWTTPRSADVVDTARNDATDPAVTINDEGDVTIAWMRLNGTNGGAVVQTFRDEPGGYVADAVQPLVARPAELGPTASWWVSDVQLVSRADGNAVAAWNLAVDLPGQIETCLTTFTSTQAGSGAWSTATPVGDATCQLSIADNHALARDGDDALLLTTSRSAGLAADVSVRAHVVDASGVPGPAVPVATDVHIWSARSDWPTVNPLVVAPNGRAAFAANVRIAGGDAGDTFTPAVWTRDTRSGTWTRSLPAADDRNPATSAISEQPVVALEDDGAVTAAWRSTAGAPTLRVARRPAGGAWQGPVTLGSDGPSPAEVELASRGAGPPVVVWLAGDRMMSASLSGAVNQAPRASFDVAPARPTVGQTVTLTSTSTDDDGTIVRHEWDLDDDGDFGDASGPTAHVGFADAGAHAVELRVTDDDGDEAVAVRTINVDPAPAGGGGSAGDGGSSGDGGSAGGSGSGSGTGSAGDGSGGGSAGGGGPSGGDAGGPPPAPRFVVTKTIDTTGRRTVPSVVGRSLDDARDKLVRGLQYVDIKDARVIASTGDLPQRPGGGRWRVGDVIGQTPDAGKKLTTSTTAQAAVTLRFWAGAKHDRTSCNELRGSLKKDDLATAAVVLKAAGCGAAPDLILVPAKKVDEPTVKSIAKDGDITVQVPTDPTKLDLRTWRSTGILGSTDIGPVAGDFSLTAGQANTIGVVIVDRAGRRVKGAKIRVDVHEVGGSDVSRLTEGSGAFATTIRPQRPGTVHVLSEFADSKGEKIYGYAAFTVKDRTDKTVVTAVGNTFTRNPKTGRYELTKRAGSRGLGNVASPRALDLNAFFDAVASCFRGFGGAVSQLTGPASEQVYRATSSMRVSVLSLWRGKDNGSPRAATVTQASSGLWLVGANGVVSAGGGNVVSAGGGNVVAAGGLNVIAAGGANVVSAGGANVVSAGGLNLLSDNGLGVISAGGGNLVRLPDGSRVVAVGGGNVVAAGGGNVVAAGGANVVSAGGANVVSAGGGNVVSAGGLN